MTDISQRSPTPRLPPTWATVDDAWIDYNGHLSEGYYVLMFSRAIDDMLTHVGLGEPYRAATNCAVFTVEAHVRYLHQVRADSTIEIRNRITAVDGKRLHSVHDMYVGEKLCATEEVVGLHVNREQERVVPFPAAVQTELAGYRQHGHTGPISATVGATQ
ncbi:thioesterase family protein [Mycolicibacterium sp. YH-1]|uniref:acyl-CoA thioesterase n=1 Tax=Mycolicibacterium sp. YH-1 TaxID=2908837 RepID=UPI001F4BD293|nr:thioesterase family protein [Mycolicibacterium sp. YH-1]UNB53731.1 acyl-CoA thioesterase [Mycolicibacterium sp. YH-1]